MASDTIRYLLLDCCTLHCSRNVKKLWCKKRNILNPKWRNFIDMIVIFNQIKVLWSAEKHKKVEKQNPWGIYSKTSNKFELFFGLSWRWVSRWFSVPSIDVIVQKKIQRSFSTSYNTEKKKINQAEIVNHAGLRVYSNVFAKRRWTKTTRISEKTMQPWSQPSFLKPSLTVYQKKYNSLLWVNWWGRAT